MGFWIFVKGVEDMAVCLLLFALLTACKSRRRRRKLAISVSVVYVVLLLGMGATLIFFGLRMRSYWPDYSEMIGLIIASMVIHVVGFVAIARFGWRRVGEQARPVAAVWPLLRLLLTVTVAVALNLVTHWNLQLAVRQRLPYPEARNQLRAINDEENLRKHGLLAMLLVPAFDQLAAAVTVGDARHRVARLAIALRAYELEHGKFPESLDGLAPEYIDQIPLDPSTDGPMQP
jgi:hypothetical protein